MSTSSILLSFGLLILVISGIALLFLNKKEKQENLNKKEKPLKEVIEKQSKIKNIVEDCEEPNGNKINICTENEFLTEADEKLREELFYKHLQHYSPEGQEKYDGKIPIPFESLIFLTKSYAPIVNEDGEIIVRINNLDSALVLSDKKDNFIAKEEKNYDQEEKDEDIFNALKEPSSNINEKVIKSDVKEDSVKDINTDNLKESVKKEKDKNFPEISKENENKDVKNENSTKEIKNIDDGFLTSENEEYKDDENLEANLEENYLKILNEESDDDFDFEDESNDDDVFENFESDDDDFDFENEEITINEKEQNKNIDINGKDEAEEFYATFFIEESKPICMQDVIVGNTVDLDDAIDAIDNNENQIQETIIKNMFAFNYVGTTMPDKTFIFPKYGLVKAIATSLTQINAVRIKIEKHLKGPKGIKDLLNCIRFITSNPEFMISDPNKPFEFISFEKENGNVCKDNVIKLSYVFIEEVYPIESDIILKYPPKVVKITNKEAKEYCNS